jgi:hypothetical protein
MCLLCKLLELLGFQNFCLIHCNEVDTVALKLLSIMAVGDQEQDYRGVYCYKGLEIAGADVHKAGEQEVVRENHQAHEKIDRVLLDVEMVRVHVL